MGATTGYDKLRIDINTIQGLQAEALGLLNAARTLMMQIATTDNDFAVLKNVMQARTAIAEAHRIAECAYAATFDAHYQRRETPQEDP